MSFQYLGIDIETKVEVYVDFERKVIQLQQKGKTEWFHYYPNGTIRNHSYLNQSGITPYMMFFGNQVFNQFDTFVETLKAKNLTFKKHG
jgi:hypothetical protein